MATVGWGEAREVGRASVCSICQGMVGNLGEKPLKILLYR